MFTVHSKLHCRFGGIQIRMVVGLQHASPRRESRLPYVEPELAELRQYERLIKPREAAWIITNAIVA